MKDEKDEHSNDPLHGVTLQMILRDVIDFYGYKELAIMTKIHSFEQKENNIMKPILKFLRKTPWAREKIEEIYRRDFEKIQKKKASR